jgi:hypothetical protein
VTGPRLSIIPARAATDPALKPRDLQVLCVLGRHTDDLGWCSKSQVKMAREMGCARSTVFEAVERLIQAGYLERYEQEGANGRDCPHLYRVILDPKHPDLSAVPADLDDGADPADQSAPPAGISAPPAGPGPAPKNDPLGTEERGRAREDGEGERAPAAAGDRPPAVVGRPAGAAGGEAAGARREAEKTTDDPAKFERRVKKIAADHAWPGWAASSTGWAIDQFAALTDAERAEAERRAGDYIAATGRKALSLGVYFKDRKWTDVPEREAVKAAAVEASPFSRAWMARWFELLLAGPTVRSVLTAMDRHVLAGGTVREDQLLREKQAKSGFPVVNAMRERVHFGQGVTVTAALAGLGHGFVALWPEADAGVIGAWEALHLMRGWPWLPEFRADKPLFFPPGEPEEALREFERALRPTQQRAAE